MQAPVTEHRVKPKSTLIPESLLSATAEGCGPKTRCLYPMESSLDVASTKWPENWLVPNLPSLLSSFPVDGTSEYQLPLNSYETADC